jgi:hypothetical protein
MSSADIVEANCIICHRPCRSKRAKVEVGQALCRTHIASNAGKASRVAYPLTGENNPNWKGGVSLNYGERFSAYMKMYRKKHPEKQKARDAVKSALRAGRSVKGPCAMSECKDTRVQAHHADYSKPLDVVWLCRPHHDELHANISTESEVIAC